MTLTVTNNIDANEQPFCVDNAYIPDQLIAGMFPRVTEGQGTIDTQSAVLARGTILGQKTLGAATATAGGGNTGNGTSSAVTVGANAKVGTYNIVFTAATKFNVFDPAGREPPDATGLPADIHYYDKGELVYRKWFYPSGKLRIYMDYTKECDGQPHSGYIYEYDENGNLKNKAPLHIFKGKDGKYYGGAI